MHIKLQKLVFDHLGVTTSQSVVITLFGDDDKPLRLVFVELFKDFICMENKKYSYKLENGATLMWSS
ncbi:MAG: hypothetical protein U0469_00015 [Candidatus Paceibacterota bacterium]|jgi:hypothetical protein